MKFKLKSVYQTDIEKQLSHFPLDPPHFSEIWAKICVLDRHRQAVKAVNSKECSLFLPDHEAEGQHSW